MAGREVSRWCSGALPAALLCASVAVVLGAPPESSEVPAVQPQRVAHPLVHAVHGLVFGVWHVLVHVLLELGLHAQLKLAAPATGATRKPRPAVPGQMYLFRAVAGFPVGAEPGRDRPRAGGAVAILQGGAGEGRQAVGRDHRHVRAVEVEPLCIDHQRGATVFSLGSIARVSGGKRPLSTLGVAPGRSRGIGGCARAPCVSLAPAEGTARGCAGMQRGKPVLYVTGGRARRRDPRPRRGRHRSRKPASACKAYLSLPTARTYTRKRMSSLLASDRA